MERRRRAKNHIYDRGYYSIPVTVNQETMEREDNREKERSDSLEWFVASSNPGKPSLRRIACFHPPNHHHYRSTHLPYCTTVSLPKERTESETKDENEIVKALQGTPIVYRIRLVHQKWPGEPTVPRPQQQENEGFRKKENERKWSNREWRERLDYREMDEWRIPYPAPAHYTTRGEGGKRER
ncbi:hypothetical protein PRIPAC_79841 [Pristionchus pacificus]|uniref:Uncharacterized protein n=1 Tax=Pristionchus pacificus TaxID=54126 RepID=A0A2A6BH54_PRIPA|nr:hypothetical protein PRIPAC_79841 [Pristionchus pacificus]|eukprot:PDM65183.1 hypothetical protein PRIPAC_52125 [Pristionchus pacificus]